MAAQLRKTFAYPNDDDENASETDAALDDEQQDNVISSLAAQDESRTALYRRIFLSLPLTGALFFLYTFVVDAHSAQQRLIAFLACSNLLCSAYILYFVPVSSSSSKGVDGRKKGTFLTQGWKGPEGPMERFLPLMNAALAAVLLIAAAVSWRKGAHEQAWREALPGVLGAMTMGAWQLLAPLDLEPLRGAKFNYKGA